MFVTLVTDGRGNVQLNVSRIVAIVPAREAGKSIVRMTEQGHQYVVMGRPEDVRQEIENAAIVWEETLEHEMTILGLPVR